MPQLLEIIFFALLACYLIFRLWSVLGQNTATDEERQNHKKQIEEQKEQDNIIPLSQTVQSVASNPTTPIIPYGIQEGLRRIQQEDPLFNLEDFIAGAKEAYEMILMAFAHGHKEELKQFLTQDVYDSFEASIKARETAGQRVESQIERIERLDIDSADISHHMARITIRYRSYQIFCTYDEKGNCLDNPAKVSKPISDIWTFQRDCQSDDPNWFLCATRTESY